MIFNFVSKLTFDDAFAQRMPTNKIINRFILSYKRINFRLYSDLYRVFFLIDYRDIHVQFKTIAMKVRNIR